MQAPDLIAAHAHPAGVVAENVPSPCISVCQMEPRSGLCLGCMRTLEEIACWSSMGEPEKQAVCLELDLRREALF
jgi:predicted Fe-S protein YdhL (DUF1289 family)